ncbi:MAG: hypothetical protein QXH91_01415 [Candidatus Bathyarchaeia archaeon]
MQIIEEECSLCGETYRYYSLLRCYQCKKLYCRNCIIFDEKGQVTCLRCARRNVSPQIQRGKYAYLSIYLAKRAKYSEHVTLPFAKIEEIIGEQLPSSAHYDKYWWSNIRNRSPSESWLTAGWSVQNVDLDRREVSFIKDKTTTIEIPKKITRKKRRSLSFKALATKTRRRNLRKPSKTTISMVQGRFKNIKRAKTTKVYRGKFKPKKAYEKRLYKPGENP